MINACKKSPGYIWIVILITSIICASVEGQDITSPDFEGLREIDYIRDAVGIFLDWNETTDDSLPITYNIYMSETSGCQDFTTPSFSTNQSILRIYGNEFSDNGMIAGKEYFFVVRASDNLGNEDNNTVEMSVVAPKDTGGPPSPFPPASFVILVVISFILIVVMSLIVRKKKSE